MKRNKNSLLAASAVLAAAWAVPQVAQAAPGMIVDFLIHNPAIISDPNDPNYNGGPADSAWRTAMLGELTTGRSITGVHVGDVITIDIIAGASGSNTNFTDDFVNGVQFSAASSNGGLQGNLDLSIPNDTAYPQYNANNLINHTDIGGDGDIDLGYNNTAQSTGYVLFGTTGSLSVTRTGARIGPSAATGTTYNWGYLGQLTFTVTAASGTTTVAPLNFRLGDTLHTTEKFWFDNGTLQSMTGDDARLHLGAGVTITGGAVVANPTVSLTAAATLTGDGTVTVAGSNTHYQLISADDTSPDVTAGSTAISDIGNEAGTFIAVLKLSGSGDLSALAAALQTNSPGWTVTANPGTVAGLPGTWDLELTTSNPTVAGANDFLNVDLATSGFSIDRVAAIPEPSTLGLAGLGAVLAAARRKRRA